jgi:hypothetical protein
MPKLLTVYPSDKLLIAADRLVEDPDTLSDVLKPCLDSLKPSCINVLMPGVPAPEYAGFQLDLGNL